VKTKENKTGAAPWARLTEDERAIKIETNELEAVIPKKNPKGWMTGIEKESFLDKATGFHSIGDGLAVVDWIMESGSDRAYRDQFPKPGPDDGQGWQDMVYYYGDDNHPAVAFHGNRPKRKIEGPQLCARMGPVQPDVIQSQDFVAVKTTYRYTIAAPGRNAGSLWTQLIVFPKGQRYFLSMDRIDSVNDSDEMFLRNDMPGCVLHKRGDTFSEIYLSYLGGPEGLRIPPSEFYEVFPPERKFGYRRDMHKLPEHFIRAYHVRDPKTGKQGPWLAGITLEPSVVHEAWCMQQPPEQVILILEFPGQPIKAGQYFSAAFLVGYFDTIEEMQAINDRYKGHTVLSVDGSGWRLAK
jgi:hypothetical protein